MSRKTGMGSFQTHKVIVRGKERKRVPRDFGNPLDIVQLAATYEIIRRDNGNKNFKEWVIKRSPSYGKKVPAKNG